MCAQLALLAAASAVVGSPVTFNWDMEGAHAALAGSENKRNIGSGGQDTFYETCINEWLTFLVEGLTSAFKDDMVKEEVNALWTTKNIALLVVGDDDFKTIKSAKGVIVPQYPSWCMRMHEGNLQLITTPEQWCQASACGYLSTVDLTPLVP
jgi:hypothetical protein